MGKQSRSRKDGLGAGRHEGLTRKGADVLNIPGDFEIIEHRFDRDVDKIRIYSLPDIHFGDSHCNIAAWRAQKKKIMSEPNSYIVMPGDLLNTATKTGKSDTYNEKISPHDQKEFLADELQDIAKKMLCILPGNHEDRVKKDSDQYIVWDVCRILGIESVYRQNAAFVSVHLGQGKNGKQIQYSGIATHGKSKAKDTRFTGYNDGIDFYIFAHLHTLEAGKHFKTVFDPQNKRVTFRPYAVIHSSTFLDYGGYSVNNLYQPSFYVENYIELDGTRKDMKVVI